MAKDVREQISVPISSEVRDEVARIAEREHRSVAGQIRHWILSALASADQQGGERAA
jgi:hypothetical protein